MARESRRVLVGKVDLDTVGTAYLLGVTREDKVEVLRAEASQEDLADPSVLCIEVGGSGRRAEGNFDHHAQGGPTASATKQAFDRRWPIEGDCPIRDACSDCGMCSKLDGRAFGSGPVFIVVRYIDQIDRGGAEAVRRLTAAGVFPTLLDVFAGLLLTERDPVEQLHKGVELLQTVINRNVIPGGEVSGFDSYAEAKAENNRQIAAAVESARWETTAAGRRLAILETEFFGAPGALYGVGAEIVVAFAPRFGPDRVPKFTVAGNGIKVDQALPALNALEEGWGGPATGTILGSPRSGSSLTLEQVVSVVAEAC